MSVHSMQPNTFVHSQTLHPFQNFPFTHLSLSLWVYSKKKKKKKQPQQNKTQTLNPETHFSHY